METEQKRQEYQELDLNSILRDIFKNIIIIMMLVGSVFMITYIVVNEHYTPEYKVQTTVAISSKAKSYNVSDSQASADAAVVFAKAVQSNILKSKVQELLNLKELPATITCTTQKGSNVSEVIVTSDHPRTSYEVMQLVLKNYQEVSQYLFTNLVVDIIEPGVLPQDADNLLYPLKLSLLAAFISFVLLVGLVSVISFLRDTIKNEGQIEAKLDIKHFATLYYETAAKAMAKTLQKENAKHHKKYKNQTGEKLSSKAYYRAGILITNPVTSFSYTESIRKLRTRLVRRLGNEVHHNILITSVSENEGKSTVAANLALSLAIGGYKVLLIDGDLRRPAQHKLFEHKFDQGKLIYDYLDGSASFEEVLVKDEKSGLYFIYTGKSSKDSTNLVASYKMQQLLEYAREHMDYVVVDSPPISLLGDAEALAEYTDATLLVVKQEHTWAAEINDAIDVLKRSKSTLLGCVFNGAKTYILSPKFRKNMGYDGKYSYGYGYGKKNAYHYYSKNRKEGEGN